MFCRAEVTVYECFWYIHQSLVQPWYFDAEMTFDPFTDQFLKFKAFWLLRLSSKYFIANVL